MTLSKFTLPKGGYAVLTLTEPWATLCVLPAPGLHVAEKEWETRSWSTGYRGLLLIQASKYMPRYAQAACLTEPFESVLGRHGLTFDVHPDSVGGAKTQRAFPFTFGAIIGAVDFVATRAALELGHDLRKVGTPRALQQIAFGYFDTGRRAFQFERPRRFATPIPVSGSLGIWPLEAGPVADRVREQLALCENSEYRISGTEYRADEPPACGPADKEPHRCLSVECARSHEGA